MAAAFLTAAISIFLLFGGFRFARSAISLWGLIVGFLIGGNLANEIVRAGPLGVRRSLLLGLAIGMLCALLSYLYYGFAIVILAGGIGYWLGSGFLLLLEAMPGTFSATAGLVVGAACGGIVLLAGMTRRVLIFLTSLAGSVAFVGSLFVMFHAFSLAALSYVSVVTGSTGSVLWLLATGACTVIGIVVQTITARGYECEKWAWGTHVGDDTRRLGVREYK